MEKFWCRLTQVVVEDGRQVSVVLSSLTVMNLECDVLLCRSAVMPGLP